MRYIFSFFLCAVLFSCSKKEEVSISIDFDTIEHYQCNSMYFQSITTDEILYGDKPTSISDLESINFMDSKFRKKIIDQKSELEIISSFSLNAINFNTEKPISTCEPIYRDLLVFKKGKKVKAIIKVCLDCSENKTLGIAYDSSKFFVAADYSKLFKLFSRWPDS